MSQPEFKFEPDDSDGTKCDKIASAVIELLMEVAGECNLSQCSLTGTVAMALLVNMQANAHGGCAMRVVSDVAAQIMLESYAAAQRGDAPDERQTAH